MLAHVQNQALLLQNQRPRDQHKRPRETTELKIVNVNITRLPRRA